MRNGSGVKRLSALYVHASIFVRMQLLQGVSLLQRILRLLHSVHDLLLISLTVRSFNGVVAYTAGLRRRRSGSTIVNTAGEVI